MNTASWLHLQPVALLVGEKFVAMHNTLILIGQSFYMTIKGIQVPGGGDYLLIYPCYLGYKA
jgi:hypothetical protein